MQPVAAERSATPLVELVAENWPVRAIAALTALALPWFVLCRQLSAEWSLNEQSNYSRFVPFCALYLSWLHWRGRPLARRMVDRR
jgi:hypothetical protein